MNKKVTIREAVNYVINSKGEKHTLLGIGPMSENFLRASLEISKEKDFPLMYIASRNQVDAYKFGGGYVFNSDQKLFKEKIEEGGFILAHWDGTTETEEKIKEETKATIRCIPFDSFVPGDKEPGKCMVTGKPSACRVIFARSY